MKTIGIFPASGGLGSGTYQHLLKLVPSESIVLINRHPEKVPDAYTSAGVRVRRASYESPPEELEAVFAGVDVLFLISYPSPEYEYRVKVHLPAVDAARRAGVKHLFYSSLAYGGGAGANTSLATVMQAHLATERHLRALAAAAVDGSFTFTAVREGLYAESFPIYTAFLDLHAPATEVLIPHDGAGPGVAWAGREDLAEATARLIARYVADPATFRWANAVVLLSGPRAWMLRESVAALGEMAGRGRDGIRIREVSVEEYARLPRVLERFRTEEKARGWATAWEAIQAGEAAVVSTELGEILGRQPDEFDDVIRRMVGLG